MTQKFFYNYLSLNIVSDWLENKFWDVQHYNWRSWENLCTLNLWYLLASPTEIELPALSHSSSCIFWIPPPENTMKSVYGSSIYGVASCSWDRSIFFPVVCSRMLSYVHYTSDNIFLYLIPDKEYCVSVIIEQSFLHSQFLIFSRGNKGIVFEFVWCVLYRDGIHLAEEGSKIVVEEILKVLKEAEWTPSLHWKSMATEFPEDSPYDLVLADGKTTINPSDWTYHRQIQWD